MMADRDHVETSLRELLRPELFRDYGPNGLQVEGRREVRRIVSGVTASLAFIEAAIDVGADAAGIAHRHGQGQAGAAVAHAGFAISMKR